MDKDYIIQYDISAEDSRSGELMLIKEGKVIDSAKVMVTEHLDSMLIKTLDKLLQKNRIKTLSLKTLYLSGKTSESSLSNSVFKAIKAALDY